MNFRLAISAFPSVGDPARGRLIAALAEATGVNPGDLLGRIESSPPWLIEVPDRDEAEAWRALLDRQRGVSTVVMPTLGAPVPSLAAAIDRARRAMGEAVDGPRGLARVADRQARLSTPSSPARAAAPPDAGVRRRGITAPVAFVDGEEPEVPATAPRSPASAPSRGITAPVDFLRDGQPSAPVITSALADDPVAPAPRRPASAFPDEALGRSAPPVASPRARDSFPDAPDEVELERRRRARGAAPTVAPAGQRRAAIDVQITFADRLRPLLVYGLPAALLVAGVFVWRYLNREIIDKPAPVGVELLDAGRAPRATLRIVPTGDPEDFSVALGLEHHFATRQLSARERISTIGGTAELEYAYRGDDHFDVAPQGRETRLGRVRLEPVRVLDRGQHGPVAPFAMPVPDEDRPAMRAFVRLIRPSYLLLPDDAVGLGARWRFAFERDESPIGIPVQVTLELLGRDAERVELGVLIETIGERDPGETSLSTQVIGPFRPRYDSPVRLFDLRGAGQGRATLSLDRLTPVSFDVDVQFDAKAETRTDFGVQLIGYRPVMSLEMHAN